MRRLSIRFAIALLTFVVGVSAATVWYMNRPTFSRAVEEENIIELVFRHQIEEEGKSEGVAVFFLSRGEDTDPSDEFMRRFVDMPGVRKFSQGNKRGDGVTDKRTGERGVILKVHRIEWISDAEVKVGTGTYAWGMGQSGYVCRVGRDNGRWIVKDCELTLIT